MIRFALIGTGIAATTHAREMRHTEGGTIVTVQARDFGRAQEFARLNSIPEACAQLEDVLKRPDVDAVIITTPNGCHLEPAVAAAEAGKHVVVEKPLEISADRAARIVSACAAHGVSLNVIYQRRHSRAALTARNDIRAGRLGKLVLVNVIDNQFRPPSYYSSGAWRGTWALEGGGCVITQASHSIDLAQFIAGPIVAVNAKTATLFHAIETEDVAVATFNFDCGALGTFSASTAAFPGLRHVLIISGTAGSIIINGEHDQIIFRSVAGEDAVAEMPAGFTFADPIDPRDYPTEGQRRQLQAIIDRLRDGKTDNEGIEGALCAVRVVDAIYMSQRTGGMVIL